MNTPYPADIRPLTSLRFFAAMVVVFHHLGYFMPPPVHAVTGFFQKGYLGVDFFFILSGFILTHVYADSLRQNAGAIKAFYVRRFARIYPLHLVTLLVMAGIGVTPLRFGFIGDWPGYFPTVSFFNHLFMLQGWGAEQTLRFNVPSWSVSAEWFAYLLFPLLALWLPRTKPGQLLAGTFLAFAALWFAAYAMTPERILTERSADFSIIRIVPEFALGMALYLFFRGRTAINHAHLLLTATTAVIFIMMHLRAPDIIIVLLFAAVIVLAADISRTGAGGWLSGRIFVWLGEISYAVYMTHYIVLTVILWGAWQVMAQAEFLRILPFLAATAVVVTISVSAFLYHTLEKPARRWITKTLTP